MRLSTITRILLGLSFMACGFIKSKRFGQKLTPELFDKMGDAFKKMDKTLHDFPGRDSVQLNAAQAQELFAYSDMICGFLLLTGNLQSLAILVLLVTMCGLEYTLFKMKSPLEHQGAAVGAIVALLSLCPLGGRKEKED